MYFDPKVRRLQNVQEYCILRGSRLGLLVDYYLSDHMNENEVGGSCGTYGGRREVRTGF